MTQLPLEHSCAATCESSHANPQNPQLAMSVARSTSHPTLGAAESCKPAASSRPTPFLALASFGRCPLLSQLTVDTSYYSLMTEAAFGALRTTFELLSDGERRAAYDQELVRLENQVSAARARRRAALDRFALGVANAAWRNRPWSLVAFATTALLKPVLLQQLGLGVATLYFVVRGHSLLPFRAQ